MKAPFDLRYKVKVENLRKVNLKGKRPIGEGAYGIVYKLSPQRVVKIYTGYSERSNIRYAKDEIRGARIYKDALPVLEIVYIEHKSRRRYLGHIGVIKRYIPEVVSIDNYNAHIDRYKEWDDKEENYRQTKGGKVYRVDTGTPGA